MIDRFERFSSAIFSMTRYWHKIATDELSKFGLKGTYAVYLAVLLRNKEGVTASRLSDICARDKADVSRSVNELEAKGIVERISVSSSGYRASIRLTPRGIDIAQHIIERACLAVEITNRDVSDKDRKLFYDVLFRYESTLKELSENGLPPRGPIKAVLFDLDGTLLPMDQDVFTRAYFKSLCDYFAPRGFDHDTMLKAIGKGTAAMVGNDGKKSNQQVFWESFKEFFPKLTEDDLAEFYRYYKLEFDKVSSSCGYNPLALDTVNHCSLSGLRTILATNPFFPAVATEKRLKWAGLEASMFEYITSYEDTHYTKPSIDYYREILDRVQLDPKDCLMVGNDANEDMVAKRLGMKVFLLTDNLINKNNIDISQYPNGGFDKLTKYIDSLA